jgi:hypothetical protein
MANKADYNKRYYQTHNPYPVRLGELKPKLQMEAFEKDTSIPQLLRKIVSEYFDRKELRVSES